MAEIHWITGPSGSGKSTRLMEVHEQIRHRFPASRIGGFIAHARYHEKRPVAYVLQCLHEERFIPLASREAEFENSLAVGRFYLDAGVFDTCTEALLPLLSRLDVLLVDEAGPLELTGGGWDRLIREAIRYSGLKIYISVRDKLLDRMKERYTE